jgi:DNA uptake protein ComE-like DNA-binding protein
MRVAILLATLLAGLVPLPAQAPGAAKDGAAQRGLPPVRKGSGLKKVDLNSASPETLAFMLKIPEAVAAKIVAARPFRTKSQLVTQGIVSPEVYASLRHKVVVKRPKLP